MSRDSAPDFTRIRLFHTEPHPCSYLDDKIATTAFVDPAVEIDSAIYNRLNEHGFRRSGKYLYMPRCEFCQACISSRVLVCLFNKNRQQRRCLKQNSELTTEMCQRIDIDEHYPLYEKYINARHRDGDMYPPSEEQYRNFIGTPTTYTRLLEVRLDGVLAAASVVDILEQGMSAIYTYFNPDLSRRGLGNYAILKLLEEAKRLQLPYLYLGYLIKNCRKMNYKNRYQPAEVLINGHWRRYDPQSF